MKKLLILLTLILIVFCAVAMQQYKKEHAALVQKETTEETVQTLCFERTIKATPDAPYSTNEEVTITLEGEAVTGTKFGTQAGPDMTNGYEGTLSGTQIDDKLELLFNYTIEGSSQAEQELYLLRDGSLFKQRYPLVEEGDVLVPDTSKPFSEQEYKSVQCLS